MSNEVEILIPANESENQDYLRQKIALALNITPKEISAFILKKRSIDARRKPIMRLMKFDVYLDNDFSPAPISILDNLPNVQNSKRVIIVGAGPAGLFAALKLIELGLKPIIFERGKDVANRKFDITDINRNISVNPESNWCFGEGGAGTYSDGKLYTRSTKRGDVNEILSWLIAHGANPDISIDAHAHIGTDKLPAIISNIRQTIIQHGGEVYFNTKITDIITDKTNVVALVDGDSNRHSAAAYILATGHSATDIYQLFQHKKFALELKSFAMGFRVEHPQSLIDSSQYKLAKRPEFLPAATYSLVQQVQGRGVFSFCMCPGGIIVPAATNNGEQVVNGMSNSLRNSPYANAGIVVSIESSDLKEYHKHGALAGLAFQHEIEHNAWLAGGKSLVAPAQRVPDFINHTFSQTLPKTSYNPGVVSADLSKIYPDFITNRLKEAFVSFNQKIKGFASSEALLLGVESRTSSPVRIPRDPQMLHHIQFSNLYPAGEGAGYAGGIVSSAIDGQRCATQIATILNVT